MRGRVIAALVAMALCGEARGAAVQTTKANAKCRSGLAATLIKLAQATLKERESCHRQRMAAQLPENIDCNDPASFPASDKVAKVITKVVEAAARCGLLSVPADNGYVICPPPCEATLTDYASVASCLSCVTEGQVSNALARVYGTPPYPTLSDTKPCQETIGAALLKYSLSRLKTQQRCQRGQDLAPTGVDCLSTDATGKIAAAIAVLDSQIAACTATQLAGLNSCANTVADQQACTRSAADDCTDALFNAVYRPALPTPTPSPTTTPLPSDTPTPTATASATPSRTPSSTRSPTSTRTITSTITATYTQTVTPTETTTSTPTHTGSETPTTTATRTPTQTATRTSSNTRTPTRTPTATITATSTNTPTATIEPTFTVDITAYRPKSEGYSSPLPRLAVGESEEETPGTGIRLNGDDDNGNGIADFNDTLANGDNDLIEITLTVDPPVAPSGFEYVLTRTLPTLKVWPSASKGTAVLGTNDEAVLVFSGSPLTLWVEEVGSGGGSVQIKARRIADSSIRASDQVNFYSFTSIVIVLGGENQTPSDPIDSNHGVFVIAGNLYAMGYDVHMYDEDNVSSDGSGSVYNEVVSAIQRRDIHLVAIYGYSHGGGSTHDLAERLDNNRGSIGTFTLPYTAYIDGVKNGSDIDLGSETRLPPTTQYHVNYYQRNFIPMGDSVPGSNIDVNLTSTGVQHGGIDDRADVRSGVQDGLVQHIIP